MEIFFGIFVLVLVVCVIYDHGRKKIDLSLSCGACGKLAEPIHGTGNRYRCNSCSNQFAGQAHNY
jgi:hypothetical protein